MQSRASTRALRDGDPLYDERHQAAARKMFAARGVDIDGEDREAIARTLPAAGDLTRLL
jgi:hypothetical protein